MSNCAAPIARPSSAIELPDQFGRRAGCPITIGQIVVVYFYPKDDTPGCTLEGKEFRDLHEKFRALDCAVVGVSTDSVGRRIAPLPTSTDSPSPCSPMSAANSRAPLACSHDDRADRATFVLDRDGRVAKDFLDVTPRGHAQRVLKFAQALVESHLMIGG